MKKAILGLAALLCTVLPIMAEKPTHITVCENGGGKTHFNLIERPEVKMENGTLHIVTSGGSHEFIVSEVEKFVFSNGDPSGVSELGDDLSLHIDKNGLSINGLRPNSTVYAYTSAGIAAWNSVADNTGSIYMPMETLATGIYIVKTESKTLKIIKK